MTTEPAPLPTTGVSLEEVHGSVAIPKSRWRRMLAFAGPAFLVSVGYMDPGNWATDSRPARGFATSCSGCC